MAPEDSRAAFMRIPWAASLLKRPDVVCRVPGSRQYKELGAEDSYFAEILKTPRTIRSCICAYTLPPKSEDKVDEAHLLMTIGDGTNGHPNVMHGGVVASVLDEAMTILQHVNWERDHLTAVGKGKADGELPPEGFGSYTAELKIRYLRPVDTPSALLVTTRYTKREGRKEWFYAELKQRTGATEDYDGDEVICATGEGLFVQPKPKKSKL